MPQSHAFCNTRLGRVPKGQGIGAAGFCLVADGYSIVGRIRFIAKCRRIHDISRIFLIVGLVANGYVVTILGFIVTCIVDAVASLTANSDVKAALDITACTRADGHILDA